MWVRSLLNCIDIACYMERNHVLNMILKTYRGRENKRQSEREREREREKERERERERER